MTYTIKKNKNLILSSSIFSGINCNNIYCCCLGGDNKQTTGDEKNNTDDGKEKKDETPNGDEDKKIIDLLLKSFEDNKEKLKKLNRENQLKITEEQIKNIKNENDAQSIINELNKLTIHNDPEKDVVLDVDNIHDVHYILKKSNTDFLKYINFIKYINDDIFEYNNEKIKEITVKLMQENKLFDFIKYDPLMFDNDKNKQIKYNMENDYLLYINRNTFNLKDYIKYDTTYGDCLQECIKDPKIFENCYFLYTNLKKAEDTITIFKKKTIIDLDHLDDYPNIYPNKLMESPDNAKKRIKDFIKKLYNVELNEDTDIMNFIKKNSFLVNLKDKPGFYIFNSTIDEIEFKGYKKSTEKPDGYDDINEAEKLEIDITNSKGTTKCYLVKEEAK